MRTGILLAGALLAATQAQAQTTAADANERYIIRKGDTLYDLADRHFLRLQDYAIVQRLNRVKNPRRLPPGGTLLIPTRLLKVTQTPARIVAFSGDVTLTAPGAAAATPAIGAAVGEAAALATGPNSFVTLELADGSRITLPSQSRAVVERLRSLSLTGSLDRRIRIETGRGEARATPAKSRGDRFLLTTPGAVASVRGTEFRVGADGDRTTVEVVEGKVAAAQPKGAQTLLPAGFGAAVSAAGVTPPIPLLPPPGIAEADRLQRGVDVAFTLTPVAAARAYHVRLARDAAFADPFAEALSDSPVVRIAGVIPDGGYFIRAVAVDENGLRGMPAEAAIERRAPGLRLEPPVVEPDGAGFRVRFAWAADGAPQYRLTLAPAGAPNRPVADLTGLAEPAATVPGLAPGVYVWKVGASWIANGRVHEAWSDPQALTIGR